MKRPLFVIGVSYFVTTWLAFFLNANTIGLSIAAAVTAVLCFLLRQRREFFKDLCLVFLVASLAFAAFWLYERRQIEPIQALAFETTTIEGLVEDVDRGISSIGYTMKASFVDYPKAPKNVSILVRGFSDIEHNMGDTIRLKVKLIPAPDSGWYRSRGIMLIGQTPHEVTRIPVGSYLFERAMLRLRVFLANNIYAKLSEENANVVAAMVLGIKTNISPEIFTAVGRSGTVHLFSVSGMHLSMIVGFIALTLRKMRLQNSIICLIALIVSFLFTLLVGFGASVLRAFVMTALSLTSQIFSRKADSKSSLGAALLLCAVIWPHWCMGWGLWLSAAATLGIIMLNVTITEKFTSNRVPKGKASSFISSSVINIAAVSVSAYAFTAPLLLLMSGWISLVSPLANILISPFTTIAILGGIVCSFSTTAPLVIRIIAAATDFSTSMIIKVSEILGSLPFAIVAIDESYLLLWLAFVSAIVVMLMFFRIRLGFRLDKKIISYALALLLVGYSVGDLTATAANRGKVELVTLTDCNVALLIREKEAVVLGTPDAYEISILLKYLNYRGVQEIAALVAADSADTVGSGVLRLASAYKIGCILAPNDAYIEEQLQVAVQSSHVYSGGYAELDVLGGVKIKVSLTNEDIYITTGKNEIVKIRDECDIMETTDGRIHIYDDGVMLLPRKISPLYEPVGARLFGESRILLKV